MDEFSTVKVFDGLENLVEDESVVDVLEDALTDIRRGGT